VYIYKRTKNYYFRVVVPRDLRAHFPCREIIKSLKTRYYEQARIVGRDLHKSLDNLFVMIRSGRMDQLQIDTAVRTFLKKQVIDGEGVLCYKGKTNTLEMVDFRPLDYYLTQSANDFDRTAKSICTKLANRDTSGMESAIMRVFGLSPINEGYRMACLALLTAEAELYNAHAELARGNFAAINGLRARAKDQDLSIVPAPPLPTYPANSTMPTKLLSEAITLYTNDKLETKAWNDKSKYENARNFELILFVVGNIEMSRLDDYEFSAEIFKRFTLLPKNRTKYARYKNKSIHEVIVMSNVVPLSTERINKYIEYLSALVKFAIQKDWMRKNHFEGKRIKQKVNAADKRDAYSKVDIERLLTGLRLCFDKDEPEKLWIALMMLFLGCRPADLVRITRDKFHTSDGILCVDLQSKTDAGARTVPVHPFLLECGFNNFLDSIQAPNGKLWSNNLKFYIAKDANTHERWYNRTFEPKFVTTSPKKSLYSIRHTFITTLKHARADLQVLKEIVGHEKDLPDFDITLDRYGKAFSPKKKLEIMNQLDYGVDLQPIKEFCRKIIW